MTDLPPFSGAVATCPKCGDGMIMTIYVASVDDAPFLWQHEFAGLDYPLLRRACACCGYAWAEAPLDATPAETMRRQHLEHSSYTNEHGDLVEVTEIVDDEPLLEAEPSIPVSRIVAVLAARWLYHRDASQTAETWHEHVQTSMAREDDALAGALGVFDAYRAELVRQRAEEAQS